MSSSPSASGSGAPDDRPADAGVAPGGPPFPNTGWRWTGDRTPPPGAPFPGAGMPGAGMPGALPPGAVPPGSVPPGAVAAPAVRPRSPWAEMRRDGRWVVLLFVGLAAVGVPLGVLWWGLAPRADFRITESGPVAIGLPSEELLAADDGVYVLLLAGYGFLAGVGAWLVRRRRGIGTLLGMAFGVLAAAAVAWQVGELLAPRPSHAALTHVGGQVTSPLSLGALPALAVGPFFAVLVYVAAALYTRTDTLGRPDFPAAAAVAADGVPPAVADRTSGIS